MITFEHKRRSVLVAGVPRSRGTPIHVEHDDSTAVTVMVGGRVKEIHTPQNYFPRVHEYIHALHTDDREMRKAYRGTNFMVRNVAEDCRIHLKFWPWKKGETPDLIRADINKFFTEEHEQLCKSLDDGKNKRGDWADFATRIRAATVDIALGDDEEDALKHADFATDEQYQLAEQLLEWLQDGRERRAAIWMQRIFFPMLPAGLADDDGYSGRGIWDDGEEGAGDGKPFKGTWDEDTADDPTVRQPKMTITELTFTEKIPEAKIGYRRSTTGPRIWRPGLRKPVLPQRLFVKRSPIEPAGTVLIDASGSMGDSKVITNWVKKVPFGTIAYYAGCGRTGELFVFARRGRRAQEYVEPMGGDNTVDGPAIDWLLTQKGPLTMVTDREFCGAADSLAQKARLDVLEARGIVKVLPYIE